MITRWLMQIFLEETSHEGFYAFHGGHGCCCDLESIKDGSSCVVSLEYINNYRKPGMKTLHKEEGTTCYCYGKNHIGEK